ncbi:MAG: hypothetical protein A3J46_04880 [Candidatus Yanofskybacteria bacterium RIFCSPHIGHO2_02_FULL_41_11]|uniref:Uncharacterized protein n=1 Tax=Candidatus Yanofskybacteria bacterium RIFCSPHIGHO2_02_FULL_41_11 TaxID=1802675 RepID=A0A1F8F863_9BACT|nr:MAG: hypothetical protein A3J46_04880 [Candidatus Yanofskybacteria bacterium RIFCSPHIGHO2_02_FULL_41_11]
MMLKLTPNAVRAIEIAQRLKEVIETTWLRDPNLNIETESEFKDLKKELEGMGLEMTWETILDLDNLFVPKLKAHVRVWKPKSITVH